MLKPAAVVVAATLVSLAQAEVGASKPALVVKVYDAVGVGASDLSQAREMTESILARAGVVAVWRDCEAIARLDSLSTLCAHPRTPEEVVVRIVAHAGDGLGEVLGFSAVDTRQTTGSLATVLADRISATAARTQSESGKLLGRVIAHEIGHLLLATGQHAAAGLMRAVWRDAEINRDRPTDWLFTGAEARQLRFAVVARAKSPEMTSVQTFLVAR